MEVVQSQSHKSVLCPSPCSCTGTWWSCDCSRWLEFLTGVVAEFCACSGG